MLRKILIGLGAVIVVLVLVIATRPSTFHVERSIVVAAPPESVFVHVNDFHAWSAWNPYEKMETKLEKTFEGPTAGPGAKYAWSGENTGKGKMTILRSDPSRIDIELLFIEPMSATNAATFTFEPIAEGTKVTWAMDGESNFIGKACSLVMNFDEMLGGDFERGLADLKATAEKTARPVAGAAAHP